ncbi:MAG: ATP-dependent protease subunit HslV [Chloroflexota bacterium]
MTTVLAVRVGDQVAMAADGQVTMGDTVVKHTAVKVRPIHGDKVLAGFAGAAADALTLLDRFEAQFDRNGGNLRKAAIELARDWRTDRYLRRLEAQLILADAEAMLLLSGDGEIIEPDHGIIAIGSGGSYALAAARAMADHTDLDASSIAREALAIAASICIYTNDEITLQTIDFAESVHERVRHA